MYRHSETGGVIHASAGVKSMVVKNRSRATDQGDCDLNVWVPGAYPKSPRYRDFVLNCAVRGRAVL